MKTAISIPDPIFRSADLAARRLKMNRSQLYAAAVAEYVARRKDAGVTEKLNEVYADARSKAPDAPGRVPGGRPLRSRADILKRAAGACKRALARVGVRAHVVRSLAYGDVLEGSDLDLLIVSYPGKTWGQVRSAVDDAARPYGVPVDVIFADTLLPAVRKAMLEDALPSRVRTGKRR